MNLIDKINRLFNFDRIEISDLRALVQNFIWDRGSYEVERIQDGYKLKRGRDWVKIKIWDGYYISTSIETILIDYWGDPIETEYVVSAPGDLRYVAQCGSYHQFTFVRDNPKHQLLETLELLFENPNELVEFAIANDFKANVFYTSTDFPETPNDFISKFSKGFYQLPSTRHEI